MWIVSGVWLGIAGGVAMLAGLSGISRRRQLRRSGRTAWAMVVPSPVVEDEPGRRPVRKLSVQFALEDGSVVERGLARPRRRSAGLSPGQKVLVWYDPADPGDVLVFGRDGRHVDWAFAAAGTLVLAVGVIIAVLG
jgi:hypothetical protein